MLRSTVDTLVAVEQRNRAGVGLHLLDFGGQIVDTTSALGRMFLTMLAGFAEFERPKGGERTAAALAHLRAQGRRATGWAPPESVIEGDHLAEDP